MGTGEQIRVVVAADFDGTLIDRIRHVSPRLDVGCHRKGGSLELVASAEVLLVQGWMPRPAQVPDLRWLQLMSAGADHAMKRPLVADTDVTVTTASGIHASPIGEYCMSMILAFAYEVPRFLDLQARREWLASHLYVPRALRGQTVGIIGYGSIGREVARLADGFGMRVVAVKRDPSTMAEDGAFTMAGTGDSTGAIPASVHPPEEIAAVVAECDFVVSTLPGTPATRHLIDATVLGAMKSTAVLVNVGRGSVIDETALVAVMADGRIAGAALDVFEEEPLPTESPLWSLPNVIVTPHVSGNSDRYAAMATEVFVENLALYLDGRPLLNVLNRSRGY
jgi:phosphoglycerate dehydrogenase-like enzyme